MRNSPAKKLSFRNSSANALGGTHHSPANQISPSAFESETVSSVGNPADQPKTVNVVDLFCGCGGLSLGFDLFHGSVKFETVLGMDVDPSALRVFNNNRSDGSAGAIIGRRADLTWFTHTSEILLYYLAHRSREDCNGTLAKNLREIGYGSFLSKLKATDAHYARLFRTLSKQSDYRSAVSTLDPKTVSLALAKGLLRKLGLTSFSTLSFNKHNLSWTEEYENSAIKRLQGATVNATIRAAKDQLWQNQIDRIFEASSKTGRGQQAVIAERANRIASFLESPSGDTLRHLWCDWIAARDTVRATFCLSVHSELERLYHDGHKVGLILGGPPCKGWSRIGRAVIQHLRVQGAHAWGSHEFGDERNELLHNYVLFVKALEPDAFLFENVAHFESTLRTPAGQINAATELANALNALTQNNLHYKVEADVVAARRFGIPQDRNRYIMFGIRLPDSDSNRDIDYFSRLRTFDIDVPLKAALAGLEEPAVFAHGKSITGATSSKVAVSDMSLAATSPSEARFQQWLRSPIAGRSVGTTDAHLVRASRRDDVEFYRHLGPGLRWMDYKFSHLPTIEKLRETLEGLAKIATAANALTSGSKRDIDTLLGQLDGGFALRLLLEGSALRSGDEKHHFLSSGYLAKGHNKHGDWLERLSPDRPCKTIVSHIGKDTYGYIHPTQPRALSIREAARIQSFPDTFMFGEVGVVDAYSMIGNAVPPMLAHELANALVGLHRQHAIFNSFAPASTTQVCLS